MYLHTCTGRKRPQKTWKRRSGEQKCEQLASGSAGGRWKWQHKTALCGAKWSTDYSPLGVTRHKSRNLIIVSLPAKQSAAAE